LFGHILARYLERGLVMKRAIILFSLFVLTGYFLLRTFDGAIVSATKVKGIRVPPTPAELLPTFIPGRLLVQFRSEITQDQARQIIAGLNTRDADEIAPLGVHVLDLPSQANEMAFQHAFQERPEVEFAELDQIIPVAQIAPNDPVYYLSANSWSLQKIKGPEAWALQTGNAEITIAILDTGVDGTHEDLIAKIVPGWNVYDNNSDTADVVGHGTGVAGVAAASSNNGIGIASVAWGCRIMPIRISDQAGYASYSSMASGLTWAADHGARVANISYNVSGSSTVSSAAKYFQSKGGLVAAASGNEGLFAKNPDDPYILRVGATDSTDTLYPWSNTGNNIDLVAPGNASVTVRGGGYGGGGGTSFSSPMVAGAAALLFSANPALSPASVRNILEQSADDLGNAGWDSKYGFGRLNLEQALNTLLVVGGSVDLTPPDVSITSPSNGNIVSGTVNVSNSASDNVGVVKVSLFVDGTLCGSVTSTPFMIKWNTRKASAGAHIIQARAYDAAGNVGVSTALTVYK
jgi:subtilisin family serine protease